MTIASILYKTVKYQSTVATIHDDRMESVVAVAHTHRRNCPLGKHHVFVYDPIQVMRKYAHLMTGQLPKSKRFRTKFINNVQITNK